VNALNNTDQMTMVSESLPFRVEIASRQNLMEVASLRSATYGKHLPALATKLQQPEPADFERGCEVFVAKSKLDGSLLGTLRTHANVSNVIPLQASLKLPQRFGGSRMVETTRLCVKGSPGASVVRSALFKALHQYCVMQDVDWMMAAGRRPVDRIYDSLLFNDVDQPGEFYPMAHAGGIPHRVMCFSPTAARSLWGACQHPLYKFVFETSHPDIDLSGAHSLIHEWDCPDTGSVVTYLPERRRTPRTSGHWASTPFSLAA
jgi:hypothetical protein